MLTEDGEHTVLAQAFLLPTGEETVLRFTYALPEDVLYRESDGTWVYRLDWQKQAGVGETATEVALRLPEGGVSCSVDEKAGRVLGKILFFEKQLSRDLKFHVRYCEAN